MCAFGGGGWVCVWWGGGVRRHIRLARGPDRPTKRSSCAGGEISIPEPRQEATERRARAVHLARWKLGRTGGRGPVWKGRPIGFSISDSTVGDMWQRFGYRVEFPRLLYILMGVFRFFFVDGAYFPNWLTSYLSLPFV